MKKFIVSRYNEDFSWVKEYTNNYIVYNKGTEILEENIFNTENIGGNQRDIVHYIYTNYDNLPDTMVFLQGYPFDHCKKEVFDILIKNNTFTPLEYYGMIPSHGENRDTNGGFLEINSSWYIQAVNTHNNQTCRYSSFDEFMRKYFENYIPLTWVRFPPGSQFIIPKENAVQYPKKFWKAIMEELGSKSPTEGHIIERALWHIFNGTYKLRKEFYE